MECAVSSTSPKFFFFFSLNGEKKNFDIFTKQDKVNVAGKKKHHGFVILGGRSYNMDIQER
jgi:hypothetical protein